MTDVEVGKPAAPTVTRTTSTEPMNPALDATWAAPAANGTTITGYEAQYRKQGETTWTDYSGSIVGRTLTLPDREAGATYEVRVRAVAWENGEPDIALSVSPASFAEGANSPPPQVTVTATRSGTSGAVTVDLAFAGGTATDGTDYTAWTLPDIQIADGQTSGSVALTFTAWDDALDEGSESIIVSGTAAGLIVGDTAITIIDDERPQGVIAAVDGEPGPWSDAGSGRANRAPTASSVFFGGGTFPVGTNVTWAESGQGAVGVLFADADGDTLTYSASAEHPALLGVSLTGSAGSATLTATLLNQGASKLNYVASDGYGGQVTRTANIGITAKTSRSVAENSAAGTAVGAPVTGTPYDDGDDQTDDALTYTLTGKAADSGLFVIDSATGQISVATGATLDYEAADGAYRETETYNGQVIAKFYRGKVNYTVDGHDAVINVLIKVTDVEGTIPSAPTVTRTEFSEPSNPALDVSWTASANGLTITGYNAQYRVKVAEGETVNAWTDYTVTDANDQQTSTLPATTTSINLPDLEAGATYEVQVRAVTTEEAEGPWSDIGEGTANTPPNTNNWSLPAYSLPWGATSVPHGVALYFEDADGDTLTYSASSQYPGVIRVWMTDGHLSTKAVNPSASTVTFGAHDAYGGYVSHAVTVTGTGNETRSVAENSAAGTHVGRALGGTPYNNVALTHTMTGEVATSGLFVLDATTGQLSVATGAALDYETKSSYTGQVHFTVQGQAALINLTVDVTDVEATIPSAPTVTRTRFSAPSNPALDATWTASANGLTITGYNAQYRKKAAEGETPAAWTDYTVTDANDQPTTALPATTTSINLPDLEAGATYEVQVRAVTTEEAEGPWSEIGEGTANRPPTVSKSIANFSLQWFKFGNWQGSTDLSGGFFQDADGDTLSYSASSAYPGVIRAWVDSSALKTQTRNPTRSAVTVTYGARDQYGGYVSQTVDVTGTMGAVQASIVENACCGRFVRNITGVPYDDGDPLTDDSLTYTLTGDAFGTGPFVHDAATGWISLGSGKSLDYETKSSYTATLSWVVQEQTASVTVNISVTDLEAGKPATPTLPRTEYSEPTDPGLDVTWTAPALTGEAFNLLQITGYEVQYRKKAADGETPAAWTLYKYDDPENPGTEISQLPATPTSVTLPGLDAGATYEAQVRAIAGVEGEGAWSDTGEGTANRPPTASSVALADATVTWKTAHDYDLGDKFTDADSDELTYAASAAQAGVLTVAITGDDSDTLTVTPANPAASVVTYTAGDAYGGRVSRTVTITGQAGEFRSVAENSAAGTAVGAPVTGTQHGTTALTYSLSGDAATYFDIDSASGQISVKQGTVLDYETTPSYTGKVHWTVQGQAAVANLTINVTDVGAGKTGTPTLTRTEFSEPSDPALDVSWTAPPDTGLTITGYKAEYRKQVAAGEDPLAWTAYTYTDSNGDTVSQLSATTTTLNLPGLDAGATYEVRVRVLVQDDGPGPWSDIGSGQANQPPAICCLAKGDSGFNRGIPWGAHRTREMVGIFSDPDGDELTYAASAQYPGILRVLGLSENASGVPVLSLRGWNPSTSNIDYTISDAYGGVASDSAPVTVLANEVRSVPENSAAGTAVGRTVVGNPYETETYTYTLTGEAATSGAFEIDSASGQISVKQGASLDYETKTSYTGKVHWTVQEQAAVVNVTINVTDATAPEAPAAPTAEPGTAEPASSLDVDWAAPGDGGSAITGYRVRYRADGESGWTAHAFSGTATKTTIGSLDAATVYKVQVLARNAEGESGWSASGTGVTGPVQLTARREVPENAQAGAPVGAPVQATDHEGHALTYTVVADIVEAEGQQQRARKTTSEFVIDAATGQIRVAHGAHLDYETAHSHQLTVQATHVANDLPDGHIVNAVISVTINVTDVDESPPTIPPVAPPSALELDPAIREVAENAPAGTPVGAPVAARGGSGDPLTYSLSGSGAFTIDSATGQIRVAAGAVLDYESTPSHAVTVTVTGGGDEATAGVTITVTDVNEAPARPQAPAVNASPVAPRTALDVTWTAPANIGPPITDYDVRYRKQGEQQWTQQPFTGRATSTTIRDLEPGATYEVQVAASNDEGRSGWSNSGTGATEPANSPDPQREVRLVVENAPAGAAVGEPILAQGGSGGPLTYSLSGSLAFTIDSTTGQIRVAAGTVLDYEARQSYSVIVSVTGDADTDAVVTVTVQVTDSDEPPPQPDAPSVSRSSISPESELHVTWSEPDMTGKPPVTSYDIAYREADGGDWTERRLDGSRTRTTLTRLNADTTYQVRVRARNDEGVSPWSDYGEGSTAEPDPTTPDPTTPDPTTPDPTTPDPTTPDPTTPGSTTPDPAVEPTPATRGSGVSGAPVAAVPVLVPTPSPASGPLSATLIKNQSRMPVTDSSALPTSAEATGISDDALVATGLTTFFLLLAMRFGLLVGIWKLVFAGLMALFLLLLLIAAARRRKKKKSAEESSDMTPPSPPAGELGVAPRYGRWADLPVPFLRSARVGDIPLDPRRQIRKGRVQDGQGGSPIYARSAITRAEDLGRTVQGLERAPAEFERKRDGSQGSRIR